MTEIKHARDMSPAERDAFIAQCKKLESASAQSTPVDSRSAKDMSETERQEWLREHKRKFQ